MCGAETSSSKERPLIRECQEHGVFHDRDKWPFRSATWSSCDFASVQLTQIHRQSDPVLTRLLQSLRYGEWGDEQEALLLDHTHEVEFSEAVKLCPLRAEVNAINERHMQALDTPAYEFECVDDLKWIQEHPEFMLPSGDMPLSPLQTLRHHKYRDTLELKEGMQVILLQNLDVKCGLVNGTTGKIVRFEEMRTDMLPRAQASSKDASRNGEVLISHEHRHYAEKQIRAFRDKNARRRWPVVSFVGGVQRTIYAHASITELGQEEPYSLLSRTQIPLLAGWAITIHKSQGMTLQNCVVSLDRAFVAGQAYVALSRAKSLRTMVVQSLPAVETMMPDKTVRDWMEETFGI